MDASSGRDESPRADLGFYYWQLNPYVEVVDGKLTGFVYQAMVDAVKICMDVNEDEVDGLLNRTEYANQAEILPLFLGDVNAIAMPVITKAFSLDTPEEFVGIIETNGLAWVYQLDPPEGNILLKGLATVWPIMLLVLILTGYAALVVWIADFNVKKNRQFDLSFRRGFFQSYWFAYISATTVGYGDKVPRSFFGKVIAVLWILCGISLMSSFTATMTTLINNLASPPRNELPPLHNVEVGVLNSSIDYRLLLERGAKPVGFSRLDDLITALQNHSIDSVALDPMVYCNFSERIGTQNQNFEFRTGITDPTVVGFIYSGKNASLLTCMKRVAFYMQHEFDEHITETFEKIPAKFNPEQNIEESMFGASGHLSIMLAGAGLLFIYTLGVLIETIVQLCQKKTAEASNNKSLQQSSVSTTANDYVALTHPEQKV